MRRARKTTEEIKAIPKIKKQVRELFRRDTVTMLKLLDVEVARKWGEKWDKFVPTKDEDVLLWLHSMRAKGGIGISSEEREKSQKYLSEYKMCNI